MLKKIKEWIQRALFNKTGLVLYFVHADALDGQWLSRLESSVRSIHPLPKRWRVCIADYSSTRAVPPEFADKYNIQYFHLPGPSPFNRSWSINYAYKKFKKNTDRYLFFTDLDLVFPPNFWKSSFEILGSRHAILIPLVYYVRQEASDTLACYEDLSKQKENSWRQFFGGACLLDPHLFERIRGFDESYVGWGAEDNDFINRIQFVGADVIKTSNIEVMHLDHPRTGESNEELVRKNRKRLKQKEEGNIPMIESRPWGEPK